MKSKKHILKILDSINHEDLVEVDKTSLKRFPRQLYFAILADVISPDPSAVHTSDRSSYYAHKSIVISPESLRNVVIKNAVRIDVNYLYARLFIHSGMTFNYPEFPLLLQTLIDLLGEDIDEFQHMKIRAFINFSYSMLMSADDRLFITNSGGSAPMHKQYLKLMGSLITYLISKKFFIYYVDTDQLIVDGRLLDDKVAMMFVSGIFTKLVGCKPNICKIHASRMFFGKKKWADVEQTCGIQTFDAARASTKRKFDRFKEEMETQTLQMRGI